MVPLFSCESFWTQWWQETIGETVSWERCFLEESRQCDALHHWMKSYCRECYYQSVLNIPCGVGGDYWVFKSINPDIEYLGIDVTEKIVERNTECGIPVLKGDIEHLPLADNQFDFCFVRHILEHLPSYHKSIHELIRIAGKEVLIVFFLRPTESLEEQRNIKFIKGHPKFENIYSRSKLEAFILDHPKTKELEWETIDDKNTILHIFLRRY